MTRKIFFYGLCLCRFLSRRSVKIIFESLKNELPSLTATKIYDALRAFPSKKPFEKIDVNRAFNEAEKILDIASQNNILFLYDDDDLFPPGLKAIPSPPLFLFALGNIKLLNTPGAAIIGSRHPERDPRPRAKRLAKPLMKAGFTIVSGLAKGCDAAGHYAALNCPQKSDTVNTIAVLATGVDVCYPEENRPLYDRILAEGGLLVGEYPPGAEPHPGRFVARDRLQSALSRGVCIIETDISGGAMHTAGFAEKQGRLIGCFNDGGEASDFLLREKHAYDLSTGKKIDKFIDAMKKLKPATRTRDERQEELGL